MRVVAAALDGLSGSVRLWYDLLHVSIVSPRFFDPKFLVKRFTDAYDHLLQTGDHTFDDKIERAMRSTGAKSAKHLGALVATKIPAAASEFIKLHPDVSFEKDDSWLVHMEPPQY